MLAAEIGQSLLQANEKLKSEYERVHSEYLKATMADPTLSSGDLRAAIQK